VTELEPQLLPYAENGVAAARSKRREGKRILFEGRARSTDRRRHGTYSLRPLAKHVAAQAATGTGMGTSAVGYVLGICKAYKRRVARALFRPNCTMRVARRSAARKDIRRQQRRKRRGWFDARGAPGPWRNLRDQRPGLDKLDKS